MIITCKIQPTGINASKWVQSNLSHSEKSTFATRIGTHPNDENRNQIIQVSIQVMMSRGDIIQVMSVDERRIEIQNVEAGGNTARTIGNRGEDPTVKILEERVGFPNNNNNTDSLLYALFIYVCTNSKGSFTSPDTTSCK